jgi:8-oxo-dGTP pyrophosphatase MutT (NUDIX family)
MNSAEHPLDCAIREFTEETGKNPSKLVFLPIFPLEEIFTGSNGIVYRHVYYLAKLENDETTTQFDFKGSGEVSQINWFNFKEAYNIFRSYEASKRRVVATAFDIVSHWFGYLFFENVLKN